MSAGPNQYIIVDFFTIMGLGRGHHISHKAELARIVNE